MKMMTTEKLIPLVCSKPELWDQSHKYYPSKDMKQRAWQFIGEKMNVTGNEAKTRWTNLRDLFRRELKKAVNMARMTGDPEAYVPRWRHFKSMLFLKDQIVKDGEELELPSLVYDESISKQDVEEKVDDCVDADDEFFGEYSPSVSPNFLAISQMPQSSGRKRGARASNGYDYNHQQSSKRQHVQENSVYVEPAEAYNPPSGEVFSNEMDEDYHFVMSILGSVRRIRPDRKTSFKMKVLQLIVDEENCLIG